MEWVILLAVLVVLWWIYSTAKKTAPVADVSMVPKRFIVFDLETTGLDAGRHEIIEIGAIRVNRDSDMHETFQTLVKPGKRVPKRITEITGITDDMVRADGLALAEALSEFRDFVGDLPLVAFNAEFDDAFLRAACASTSSVPFANEVCCALQLSRRAWPWRKSFRLADIARDGNLSMDDSHRALGDCRRTMIVYISAAREVGTYR
ncbi:3'-5' exonuclease [Sphingomonas sp. RB56-2]|uniref:DNA-directed DNA polymerase n=1 Tax=Sphingomonas brevis TaxID=2908206 RepID=A0ABT0SBM5_9SPHN|nr:3'-5' exonuclease [Sphingomonas brevis]MCL6741804.1 3'-5' exonuclease [Sphingomonas brevis]